MMRLWVEVDLTEGADPLALADRLFGFLASDPDDLFPEIETVYGAGWDGRREP